MFLYNTYHKNVLYTLQTVWRFKVNPCLKGSELGMAQTKFMKEEKVKPWSRLADNCWSLSWFL